MSRISRSLPRVHRFPLLPWLAAFPVTLALLAAALGALLGRCGLPTAAGGA